MCRDCDWNQIAQLANHRQDKMSTDQWRDRIQALAEIAKSVQAMKIPQIGTLNQDPVKLLYEIHLKILSVKILEYF